MLKCSVEHLEFEFDIASTASGKVSVREMNVLDPDSGKVYRIQEETNLDIKIGHGYGEKQFVCCTSSRMNSLDVTVRVISHPIVYVLTILWQIRIGTDVYKISRNYIYGTSVPYWIQPWLMSVYDERLKDK